MRAVRFDAFGEMPYVAEVPVPAEAAGGAIIGVEAAGLCRSDWHGWQGHDPDIASLPHTPGHEFAGVVRAVGDGVTRVHVGDRVAAEVLRATSRPSIGLPPQRSNRGNLRGPHRWLMSNK